MGGVGAAAGTLGVSSIPGAAFCHGVAVRRKVEVSTGVAGGTGRVGEDAATEGAVGASAA